jgi:hypothetical protein
VTAPPPDKGPVIVIPKQTVPLILDGTVTAARLPLDAFTPKHTEQLRARRYDRDDTGQIIKRRAGKPICRLLVVHAEQVRLDTVTDETARAEGYQDADDLALAYMECYDRAWTDTDGWLVQFTVDRRDTVRLLPRQNGARFEGGVGDREDAGQYTASRERALTDEPEAVDPRLVEAGATALEARQRWQRAQLQRQQRQARMPLGERVERELAAARAAGVETWRYERAILARLEALARRRSGDGGAPPPGAA